MSPLRRLVHWLSSRPTLWNLFRRLLEFNFREEKRVIGVELKPQADRIRRDERRRPRVLDLGCGTGELAAVFLKRGYSYAGIDIEPERIAYGPSAIETIATISMRTKRFMAPSFANVVFSADQS